MYRILSKRRLRQRVIKKDKPLTAIEYFLLGGGILSGIWITSPFILTVMYAGFDKIFNK